MSAPDFNLQTPPGGSLAPQPVQFQTFGGSKDPVRKGKGSVRLEQDCLVLQGRPRRFLSFKQEDEVIPLADILDVTIEGQLVRFRVVDRPARNPRLLRLATPEAAMELALRLPTRVSEAALQEQADADAFAHFLSSRGRTHVTLALVALNLLAFAWAGIQGAGWIDGKAHVLLELGGNLAPATVQGEWWRLLSAMFLHSGLIHLAFNMLALWDAGQVTERLLGRRRFLFLYLLAGLAGGIASINWQQDKVGIGASGAVFGIYGALATALLVRRDLLPASVVQRLRFNALLFIGYSLFYGAVREQVDNAAHLGGLVTGALLAVAYFAPRGRALVAAVVLVGLGFGTFRAVEVAEPYRDEIAFRQFLADYSQEEQRLNQALKQLAPPGPIREPARVAERLETEVIVGWRSQEERINGLDKLAPRNSSIREPLARFIALKREGLEIFRDALRSNDQARADLAMQKMAEANKVMEALSENLGGKGKAGK